MSKRSTARHSITSSKLALIVAVIGSAYSIAPLYWALTSSFRAESDIFKYMNPITWRSFVPAPFTLDNVSIVIHSSFPLALGNSLLVTAATIIIGLLISVPAAFALSAVKFKGQNLLFVIVLISFLIPFDSISIPLSSTFRTLGLQDSYPGLFLPAIANGLAIFQLRQFFLAVPEELMEAGRLDGLSWFGVMTRIYVPLARPAIIGAGLLIFVFQWQSYLWPLLISPSPQYIVAPIAIANYAGEHSVAYGAIFLAGVITAVIPLVVVLVFQRYFTQSIATSGSKG